MAKIPAGLVPVKLKAATVIGGKKLAKGATAHVDPAIARRMAERGRVEVAEDNRAVQDSGRADDAKAKADADAEAKAKADAEATGK